MRPRPPRDSQLLIESPPIAGDLTTNAKRPGAGPGRVRVGSGLPRRRFDGEGFRCPGVPGGRLERNRPRRQFAAGRFLGSAM